MRLPDHYGYGALFAYSGVDGENFHGRDFVAVTMPSPVTLRFDANVPVTLSAPLPGGAAFTCVLSDLIIAEGFTAAFADGETVIGCSSVPPAVAAGEGGARKTDGDLTLISADGFVYALALSGERFAFCRAGNEPDARSKALRALALDLSARVDEILGYYRRLPPCPRPEYERLYYKCLAVNRVNVYSPQNGVPCRYTTPDRLPHRHMWLWDSMFHAMAIVRYDPALAKDAVRAVLACQRADGFIPHMMKSRADVSSITQPTVVAWALYEIYRRDGDLAFLRETAPAAAAFLRWFAENRDQNRNSVQEWYMNFDSVRCRCDESGMDNSPRFDVTEPVDAIDAVSFFVHDCLCLSGIFTILGDKTQASEFAARAKASADAANALLWDESVGAYTDRTLSGRLTGVLTPSSFLPMFAGFCPPRRAERLVRLLKDPEKFASPFPIPSVTRDDPAYGSDMWRGGVWLNYNYMVSAGLRRCGYEKEARALLEKTLECVNRRFLSTGAVFEFYDPEDKTDPWFLHRKGEQPTPPDYRVKMHAITDYNWSASFLLLMLFGD
ncbi:MAG: hypothetical protein IK104_09285 [Clostridia bacterium]|nr:hypothetical protein [Clostridia bacterium]